MSAIAYITDSKLLQHHRLNANKTMNFWRVSSTLSFSDFKEDDLLFFLSKDKEHMRLGEKGIVGYGKLVTTSCSSPKLMWDRYSIENGYNSYDEFKDALRRVTKDGNLPTKMTSLYLNDVVFFQSPIYLSECGIEISKNVESYIYINPEETVIKLLDYAKDAIDIWSSSEGLPLKISQQQLEYAVKLAQKEFGDYIKDEEKLRVAHRTMLKIVEANPICKFVGDSLLDLCIINENDILITLYYEKGVDKRLLMGQAELYKLKIRNYYPNAYHLYFKTSNGDKEVDNLLNRY